MEELKKEVVEMKIEIDNEDIENLKELKASIQDLLNAYTEDMKFTEQNISSITEKIKKVNSKGLNQFKFGLMKAKIVSSDGTKLTIM